MDLFENYNTSKQKYGVDLTKKMINSGIPPKYLLAACRFFIENDISIDKLVFKIKQWNRYVAKYYSIDINKINYEQFETFISKGWYLHCIPNIIFQNSKCTLGRLNNAKDVQSIPTNNNWCINSQSWFDRYINNGHELFAICLPNQPYPYRFVIADIINGNVFYYNSLDQQQFEDLQNISNCEHTNLENKLSKEVVDYLYNIAAKQTENKLMESKLRGIIKELARKILTEINF